MNLESVRFEGYGPGGAAILADCVTGDRERTGDALRRAFGRFGGHLGATGAVSYLFNDVGMLLFPPDAGRREELLAVAHAAGAEDVFVHPDGSVEVLTAPAELDAVSGRLRAAGFVARSAAVTVRSTTRIPLAGASAELLANLLEELGSLEGVRHVYSNATVSDALLARLPA